MTPRTFYNYFPSKGRLFIEAGHALAQRHLDMAETQVLTEPDRPSDTPSGGGVPFGHGGDLRILRGTDISKSSRMDACDSAKAAATVSRSPRGGVKTRSGRESGGGCRAAIASAGRQPLRRGAGCCGRWSMSSCVVFWSSRCCSPVASAPKSWRSSCPTGLSVCERQTLPKYRRRTCGQTWPSPISSGATCWADCCTSTELRPSFGTQHSYTTSWDATDRASHFPPA